MKGDFSRSTFRPEKHYSGVRLQQGRVQVDADWNEQVDIASYQDRITRQDVIGLRGAPMADAGFELSVKNANLIVGDGRYYVDGICCENDAAVAVTDQPDLPGVALPTVAGLYLCYLDAWDRHLTALEDPSLREVALSGADTATRTRTVWQVRMLAVDPSSNCLDFGPDWVPPGEVSTGTLRAQADPAPPDLDKCSVPPDAGFRRLENQLYRVQIHKPGNSATATFLWSRDNGAVVTRLVNIDGLVLTVSDPGRDQVVGFAPGQWVELSDEGRVLRGEPGALVKLASVQGNALTIAAWPSGPMTMADFGGTPTVRRWDSDGASPLAPAGFVALEDGVEVQFASGTYQTGDYWTIPARTRTGDVEWPLNGIGPAALPREGTTHHFAPLALAFFDGNLWSVTDCRTVFPPLTELVELSYVGGDGQEAMPDLTAPAALVPLPRPLEVAVSNGTHPVEGALVRFEIPTGGGSGRLNGAGANVIRPTDADGIASASWSLDSQTQVQRVTASLLDVDGNPHHVPVHFAASLSVAAQVAYDPANCPDLADARTVQQALDGLCREIDELRPKPGNRVQEVRSGSKPLENDTLITPAQLGEGIQIICEEEVEQDSVADKPVVTVVLDLPFPVTEPDRGFWRTKGQIVGTMPLTLRAQTNADNALVLWMPHDAIRSWLVDSDGLSAVLDSLGGAPVLAHLTVCGNFIWGAGDKDKYVDGDTFGVAGPTVNDQPTTAVRLPTGDGVTGGDLRMWFRVGNREVQ